MRWLISRLALHPRPHPLLLSPQSLPPRLHPTPSLTTLPFILKFCDSRGGGGVRSLMAEDGNIYTERRSEVRDSTIQKAFLSSDLSDAACLAFILLSGPHTLAFSLLVSDSWTMVKDFGYPPSRISDIAFHDGRCFILDSIGRLRVSDIGHSDPPNSHRFQLSRSPGLHALHHGGILTQSIASPSTPHPRSILLRWPRSPFHVHSIDLSGNLRSLDAEEFSAKSSLRDTITRFLSL
ncbi:hypothetical protein J5N97_022706 [Dioscorea zingiberensis]|uniref:KIB1-4 beta-propeller domain-containing protein n=1 Tax=Dioscorea zingiberensis TaxID=325984 RepID=A0A9D5HAW6_9LILI|nr:hypothetical protein J5N97_022706 [Dioscorea zingiberensis]